MSRRRILIAPDSFKGTLSSQEVCRIASEIFSPEFDCVGHPLGDGGEGTLTAIANSLQGEWQNLIVQGPLPGQKVDARYLWLPARETAVIEMAIASGLPLVPVERRNPEITTSFGTGELINHAVQRGAKQISLAIGGSATNDAGLGLLMALGWQFLDGENQSVGWGGQALAKVRQIIPPAQSFTTQVTVLADVTNSFYGSQGAAFVYAPQKGADTAMVQRLDQGLRHFADVVQKFAGFDLNFPGAGAAGGMGGSVVWGLKAKLESGFTAIAKLTKLKEAIKNCDLVITGEGCFDHQSLQGKVVGGVINLAQKWQKPAIIVAGQSNIEGDINLEKMFTLVGENRNLDQALADPRGALTRTFQLVKAYLLN